MEIGLCWGCGQQIRMKEMLNRALVVVIIESVTLLLQCLQSPACSRPLHQHWPAGEIFKHTLGVAAVSSEEAGHWHGRAHHLCKHQTYSNVNVYRYTSFLNSLFRLFKQFMEISISLNISTTDIYLGNAEILVTSEDSITMMNSLITVLGQLKQVKA